MPSQQDQPTCRGLAGRENIVLIGMPGAGKSTVGVLLAKETGRYFLDTDVYMQARDGRPLQAIIDQEGLAGFCRLEEQYVQTLDVQRHVIATGGSVVYSAAAMAKLSACGVIVYLRMSVEGLRGRLANLATRGVVMAPGERIEDIYRERRELYERWAEMTVDCDGRTQDAIAADIVGKLGRGGA